MKRIALLILALVFILSSCSLLPVKESEKETAAPASAEQQTEKVPEGESETESAQTDPPSTEPAIEIDPEADLAEYREISARAAGDVRYGFVKAFIDGDAAGVLRSTEDVDLKAEHDPVFDDWARAFDGYRSSFKITRYACREEVIESEWGTGEETVVFSFTVYESSCPDMPVGEKRFDITNSYISETAVVNDHEAAENSRRFSGEIPEDADLVWFAVPCLGTIADGYNDGWSSDGVIMDIIFLSLPGVSYSDDAPGMTAEEISDAAKELFGIDAFNVSDTLLYVGEDGLYHIGGHGGSVVSYYVTYAGPEGDGYRITIRSYADSAHLIPSDLYEIRIVRGRDRYDWVFESVTAVERGEIRPYGFMA